MIAQSHRERARERSFSRALVTPVAFLLAAMLVTGAQAQLIQEVPTPNELAGGKKYELVQHWAQVAGARHPEKTVPEGSATPFAVDLFTVRFRNPREGFAGGAVCTEQVPPEQVPGCERAPVIYGHDEVRGWHESYRSDEPGYVGAVAWIGKGEALAVGGTGTYPRREPKPPEGKSYADMSYAKRVEHDRDAGAGTARAWHYKDFDGDSESEWREITEELPRDEHGEPMRGLNALDVWIGREQDKDEWGLAGAYGQIWEWEGGRFTGSRIDRESPSIGAPDPEWAIVDGPTPQHTGDTTTRSDPEFFQFRVREIRIAPDSFQKRAFAFTAGCCGPDSAGRSRRIEYLSRVQAHQAGVPPEQAPPPDERPRWIVSSQTVGGNPNDSVYSFGLKAARMFNPGTSEWPSTDNFGEPKPEHESLIWGMGFTTPLVQGGPGEPPSPLLDTSEVIAEPDRTRIVASDGDLEHIKPGPGQTQDPSTPGDKTPEGMGNPDWQVGLVRSSDEDIPEDERERGYLLTTREELNSDYGGIRPYCPHNEGDLFESAIHGEVYDTGQDFNGNSGVNNVIVTGVGSGNPQYASQRLQDLRVCRLEQVQNGEQPSVDEHGPLRQTDAGVQKGPSYPLNAIDMLDEQNVGYAVGDRGAILRFGSPAAESDPPSVGRPRPAPLSDRSPYDDLRPAPATSDVGEVPSLASRPREHLSEPRLVRAGSSDGMEAERVPAEEVNTIVMSRDGSEGWAIGPSYEAMGESGAGLSSDTSGAIALYHYTEGAWRRCEMVGIPGLVEPDRACASLRDLYLKQGATGKRIKLTAAARVPLENDDDPSNDDEFEVVAAGTTLEKEEAGTSTLLIPIVVRYSEGRWQLEDLEVRRTLNLRAGMTNPTPRFDPNGFGPHPIALAFTAPDEGWMLHAGFELSFYDGQRWWDCTGRDTSGTGVSSGPARTGEPLANREVCGDLDNRLGGTTVQTLVAAGERVYLAGRRVGAAQACDGASPTCTVGGLLLDQRYPLILYKDRGKEERWRADGGGFDPGFTNPAAANGEVRALAVTERPDGRYEGWAAGLFGRSLIKRTDSQLPYTLMRLDPADARWRTYREADAAHDHMDAVYAKQTRSPRMLALPGSGGAPGRAYIASIGNTHPLAFNPTRERWELAESPSSGLQGRPLAFAPDGEGGAWAAYASGVLGANDSPHGLNHVYFYRYTDSPPREVFEETALPLDGSLKPTALAGGADGSVWLATDSGTVLRYDRIGGWERVRIPGWDPGRVVTRRTPVHGVAVGADGQGLAVGGLGKIARLSSGEVALDPAAGTLCEAGTPTPPCGTSFDLHEVAIAPDGSALAGGEKMVLLWRPAGGELRRTDAPDAPLNATITGIAMPSPERAWVAVDTGQVFAGALVGEGEWRWQLENLVDLGDREALANEDERRRALPLRAITVDAAGHGFAVGDRGVVIERTGEDGEPWRRVDVDVSEDLTSVALPAGEGSGALIGGNRGLILTLAGGEWQIARPGDVMRPAEGAVADLALLAGARPGQAEAWALVRMGGPASPTNGGSREAQLLHYTSDDSEPLLTPGARTEPLPDTSRPREGELSFAAFGRSDCHRSEADVTCNPPLNGTLLHETIARRVRDEIVARATEPGGPTFAVHTGDVSDVADSNGYEPLERNLGRLAGIPTGFTFGALHPGAASFRRFNEQVSDALTDRGVPVFGTIGSRDLSETRACVFLLATVTCAANNRDRARAGENLAWRQAMAAQPAPWGAGDEVESGSLSFEPVRDGDLTLRVGDVEVDDPSQDVDSLAGQEPPPKRDTIGAPTGGASTHYAFDVVDNAEGEALARVVVVDTSLGALAASDPVQNPQEGEGGQLAWLDRMTCIEGTPTDTGQCTREPDQHAIVVSNTPTYTYAPIPPTDTQLDGTVFEQRVLQNEVDVVVSGRLGWNGLYWTQAPGVHSPQPGGDYPTKAPEPLPGQGSPVPFVVASGAGGRFGPDGRAQANAAQGFWHGYAIVRLHPSGDPAKTIVEQRPVFEWVGVTAREHTLSPGEDLSLHGIGREPIGALAGLTAMEVPVHEIDAPAITHRYELVLADPEQPWVPCEASDAACRSLASKLSSNLSSRAEASRSDAAAEGSQSASATSTPLGGENPCDPYLCLPGNVGTIDPITGEVKAGNGKYPDTFAGAILSVGDHVATWPLVFKKSPSFIVAPLRLAPPVPAPPSVAPNPPQPPQPPTPPQPNVPQASVPEVPPPPPVPPIAASEPPELQPPAPPAPPPPSEQLSPLDLTINPASLTVSTPAAVIQPPTPPVNPAPPSGARREARQRQAATQKSGADSGSEEQQGLSDTATGPPGASGSQSMTRHEARRADRQRPEPSFTALARAEQPSAWAQGALYTGAIALMAAALAAGWSRGRPSRRPPEIPSPAWSYARWRR